MYRVLIVDDHAAVRKGVRELLSEHLRPEVQAEATNADEAIELVRHERWDVVVLDVNMPGKSGIEVLRVVKQTDPDLPVVMLSACPPEQLAPRLLAAGAAAYVSKDSAAEELVSTIRRVVRRHEEGPAGTSGPVPDETLTAWHL